MCTFNSQRLVANGIAGEAGEFVSGLIVSTIFMVLLGGIWALIYNRFTQQSA